MPLTFTLVLLPELMTYMDTDTDPLSCDTLGAEVPGLYQEPLKQALIVRFFGPKIGKPIGRGIHRQV